MKMAALLVLGVCPLLSIITQLEMTHKTQYSWTTESWHLLFLSVSDVHELKK